METSVAPRYILRSVGGRLSSRVFIPRWAVGLLVSESCNAVRVSISSNRRRKPLGRYVLRCGTPLAIRWIGLRYDNARH